MSYFFRKKFIYLLPVFTLTSTCAFASDFNIPFVNAASLGTAYADWATAASDASTSFTNPAGLTYLKRPQLVFAPIGIQGNTKFTGSALTPPTPGFPFPVSQSGSASSHIGAFMPSFYFSFPVNDRMTLAVGETVPFALGTNYAKDSLVRYASTRSQIVVMDFGPSLGYKMTDKFSVGLGFDAARMAFTLNNMYGPPLSIPDSEVQNHLSGWAYGWHAGALYQIMPATRLGLSFNSMLMFHTTGDSEVFTPLGAELRTTNQKTNAALPARIQLSAQQDLNSCWTAMATIFYTNWRTLEKITMKNVMTPFGTTTPVSIPLNYHNTFDYSLGTSFKATEKWLLRGGVNFLQTPSNNQNRGVADPIGSATILGVGAHYQQNYCLGYDIGYAHSFFRQESVNLVNPLTSLSGHNNTQTNVYGAQVTWNIT